jgi:hypothetical protein
MEDRTEKLYSQNFDAKINCSNGNPYHSIGSPMHRRSIDNIDNVNVRPWYTVILPRTFLDLFYDTVAIPLSVPVKRVLFREKGMESLEKLFAPVYS